MNNKLKLENILAIFVFASIALGIIPHFAKAGGDISGGGDSLVCDKPFVAALRSFDFSDYVYLADSAEQLRGATGWASYDRISTDDILQTALAVVREGQPDLATQIAGAIASFQWKFVPVLEELDDDNIQNVPEGCRKQQLAIQDLESGQIRVNFDLYRRLSNLEHALLQIHEAYIRLQTPDEIRMSNTQKIRDRVAGLLASSEFRTKVKQTKWCWNNPAHAYTAIFFAGSLDSWIVQGAANNWFELVEELPIGSVFSVGLNLDVEMMWNDALTHQIESFMLTNGAEFEPNPSGHKREGEIWSAFRSRNHVTVSDLAHIIDSVFAFKGETLKKQSCLSQ